MRFFELDENKTVHLNKVWIQLIPEFKKLITRDKGSPGDYDGRHKLKARQDFTFIYFFCDFNSPIRDWEPEERQKEACYYAGLEEKHVIKDDDVWVAINKYEELLLKSSLSLRTYKALLKAKDELDKYYEDLDFTKTDKQGKLLNNPLDVANSVGKLQSFYEALKKFGKAVEEELKESGTKIRGTAEKGENEDKVRKWSEREIATESGRRKGTADREPDMKQLTGLAMIPATELELSTPEEEEQDEDDNED